MHCWSMWPGDGGPWLQQQRSGREGCLTVVGWWWMRLGSVVAVVLKLRAEVELQESKEERY